MFMGMFDQSAPSAVLQDDFMEDVWSKFDSSWDLETWNLPCSQDAADCLVNHDCMWTGHCSSKEHNSEETRQETPGRAPPAKQQVQQQQSLLKNNLRTSIVSPHSVIPPLVETTVLMPVIKQEALLATPPMSDDDEEGKPTQTMQELSAAILENIIDDNGDLSDYFKAEDEDFGLLDDELEEEQEEEEEEDEEEEEEEDDDDDEEEEEEEDSKAEVMRKSAEQMRAYYAAESDHSYHKGNQSSLRNANLGIDTPSDSEEEIDVVSVGDKFPACKPSVGLPTFPSPKDRHHIQRTMQSRFPPGIKTLGPLKRRSAAGPSQPRRMPEARPSTTKARPYRRVGPSGHRAYRRRNPYSSDSDHEPSEKRSIHNNMERQRRIDLRNLFDDLKVLVPDVNKKQRAAKVLILRAAAQYCRGLTASSAAMNRQVDEMRRQQERLRAKVSSLRRNLAASR